MFEEKDPEYYLLILDSRFHWNDRKIWILTEACLS
jgi:hypothetical protein